VFLGSECQTDSLSLVAFSPVLECDSCTNSLVSNTSSSEPEDSLGAESSLCSACSPSLVCVFNASGCVTSAVSISNNSPSVASTLSGLLAESGEPDLVSSADSSVSCTDSESLNDGSAFLLADDSVDALSSTFQYWDTLCNTFLWSEPELSF
jgi:hypothetical protein